jgi:hypothetical protein
MRNKLFLFILSLCSWTSTLLIVNVNQAKFLVPEIFSLLFQSKLALTPQIAYAHRCMCMLRARSDDSRNVFM